MIVEMLQKEIARSKKTRYQIAKETGISQAQLCRLMQGKVIINCKTAEVLLKYFGYSLKKGKVKK